MALVRFMTSTRGRVMRVIAGLVLMSVGLLVIKETPGQILALAALIPIAGGVLDFCMIGAVLGYPLSGEKARAQLAQRQQA